MEATKTQVNECPDAACQKEGCPEHPTHNGRDHTYEQHHDPSDHGGDGAHPELCRCAHGEDDGLVI